MLCSCRSNMIYSLYGIIGMQQSQHFTLVRCAAHPALNLVRHRFRSGLRWNFPLRAESQMADQRYDFIWFKFALLLIGLPFSLTFQLLKNLWEVVFPPPLRWEWDNVANVRRRMTLYLRLLTIAFLDAAWTQKDWYGWFAFPKRVPLGNRHCSASDWGLLHKQQVSFTNLLPAIGTDLFA